MMTDLNCKILSIAFIPSINKHTILAASNSRNLSNKLVRTRSSNIWSYGFDIDDRKDKVGDLLVQFKNKNGEAGDLYMYYDVPVNVYRRWQSAPSKGHYFWVYIRDRYKYRKLTGNKRGVLPNAVN